MITQQEKLKNKILSDLRKGMDTHKIAKKYGVSVQTVAAYKAHMTMGTYE
jgi:DNA-binding NarL/FixJ family response regulator